MTEQQTRSNPLTQRHLAERRGATDAGVSRTLLLVDEPELYLHPQAVELVRVALKKLSEGGYQVVFSTPSPQTIRDDDEIVSTVIAQKHGEGGTNALTPMSSAVDALSEGKAQRRVLIELGNAAQVLFSHTGRLL